MLPIKKYFRDLSEEQEKKFAALGELYSGWNAKINLISRKDIDNLYEKHVLHSLGIAKVINFRKNSLILDVGTGGGFPGIPLAILFPEVHFILLDSIGKKIRVAEAISAELGLDHVKCIHSRIEEEKRKADFIVSRAVMPLNDLVKVAGKNIRKEQQNALPNGFICLKGGDLQAELQPFGKRVIEYDLSDYFEENFFLTKKVIFLPFL